MRRQRLHGGSDLQVLTASIVSKRQAAAGPRSLKLRQRGEGGWVEDQLPAVTTAGRSVPCFWSSARLVGSCGGRCRSTQPVHQRPLTPPLDELRSSAQPPACRRRLIAGLDSARGLLQRPPGNRYRHRDERQLPGAPLHPWSHRFISKQITGQPPWQHHRDVGCLMRLPRPVGRGSPLSV